MKVILTITYLLLNILCFGQQAKVEGAYKRSVNGIHTILLIKDGYVSETSYKDKEYVSTKGGPYKINNKTLEITLEYNDANANEVGTKTHINLQEYQKQPTVPQDLDALWRITGRMQNNQMSQIQRADRKTIKILVDGYFQWIAINPKEKGFYGTGGGTYTFNKQTYTENLIFFSRDNSRVGQSLSFKGELINNQWHHSGLSSKGDPIHEIWSQEKN